MPLYAPQQSSHVPALFWSSPVSRPDQRHYSSLRYTIFIAAAIVSLVTANVQLSAQASAQLAPDHLQCDALTEPVGIDSAHPMLSWQLRDDRHGALQTAYQVQVASRSGLLNQGKADIWDSGKISSDQSAGVPYDGPPLEPSKRYFWRVQVWGAGEVLYPPSQTTWWETGLLSPADWHGKWIGYEEDEHRRLREAKAAWITNPPVADYKGEGDTRHEFRLEFQISNTPRRADLFVTGEDTAAAWVNGAQVLAAQPLPGWKQMPWKTYSRVDVTSRLKSGKNLLALEVTLYSEPRSRAETNLSQTPMNATLYIQMNDGSVQLFKTGDSGWKSALNAQGKWYALEFSDEGWTEAVPYQPSGPAWDRGPLGEPWPTSPVMILRKSVPIAKPIESARLYATALGSYKFHINGREVGDQILAPGWMDFREHVAYQVWDVTDQLTQGGNAIAAYLAPGWYTTPLQWFRQGYNYGDTPPALRAQLRVAYADGSVDWIATDESWKADVSPIVGAEIYDGETYDARQVQPGWDTATFDDNNWKPVQLIQPKEPEIVAQSFQPIRAAEVLPAESVTQPRPGVYVYDFGQNLAGVVRLQVSGTPGTDVKLRFAEVLNPDGTIYVENLRTAKATDHYILAGKGNEQFQPQFTFHGFRYAEITGLSRQLPADAVKAVAYYTAAPFTLKLKTDSAMINRLWRNILWGQRSNFVGVPTDCPQRDERLGWTGDAEVFWRTATFNMDLEAFSRKFAGDLRGTQVGTAMYGIFAPGTNTPNPGHAAAWSDAGVIVPWTSWIQTGDKSIVEQNWDAMEKYLQEIRASNPDYLWKNNYGAPFGDWLSPEGVTPEDLIATAYWAYDARLMQQMAHALGRSDDERKYEELFAKIKAAFRQAFVRSDGFVGGVAELPYSPPGTPLQVTKQAVDTQTSYVLALHMDLLPEELRSVAAKRLVDKIAANDGKLATGFLGTPYLLEVLTDTGHSEVAYKLLLNTAYPSWGYLVEHGATTMWERWNGDQMMSDPGMNSYNHYAYGAVAEWIYRYAAGIDADATDPGFHTIRLHPNFDSRLGNLDLSYESRYGAIHSAWQVKGSEILWDLTLPPNTKGRLALTGAEEDAYKLEGQPIGNSSLAISAGKEGNSTVYELRAGKYQFRVTNTAGK